ncbi:MAG: exodeoxyribonuclease VII small subunit [Thermoplasmatota archaeon]
MKFEEALRELEKINDQLERNQISLEKAINLYNRGIELINYCREKLEEAEGKIEKITENNECNPIKNIEDS